MSTVTMLGVLRTEGAQQWGEDDRNERASAHLYRPAGTPLRNDGVRHFWMHSGYTYRAAWDGTGWHVTCDVWASGHVYRLADADAQFVETLPLQDDVLLLDKGRTYEIREVGPGSWALYIL